MGFAVPHVAYIRHHNAHLHCKHCKASTHSPFVSDIIQRSIEAVREQIDTPDSQIWAGARGYDSFRSDNPQLQPGEKPIRTIREAGIDPVYQQAINEVREGAKPSSEALVGIQKLQL